jgi:hypothetical protein
MSDTRGPIKVPNLITVVMLILTTVSMTYALSTGGRFVSLVESDKERQKEVQVLRTEQSVTQAKLDALQSAVNELKVVAVKTQDLVQQHIIGGK